MPGIVPVLEQVAQQSCLKLTVTTVSAAGGAQLLSSGKVDAWVPDSRQYGFAAGAKLVSKAPSVAWSPVVMASAPTTVSGIARPSWSALIAGSGKLAGLTVTKPPICSGVALSLAGTLTTLATAGSGGDGRIGLAGAASALSGIASVDAGSAIAARQVRVTESRLVGNAAVLNTAEGVPVLDLPWIAAPKASAAAVKASATLLTTLKSSVGAKARAAAGYVDPGVKKVVLGKLQLTPISAVNLGQVPEMFAMTGEGNRPGNTLAVLDVSGSMAKAAANGVTPMQGVKNSAPLLLGALSPQTKIGLWKFGSMLDGSTDWVQLAPIAPLSTSRQFILDQVASVQPLRTGTSLNATVLAAYRYLQDHYDPKATNLVGVFTDGRDEDAPKGIDLPTLTAELAKTADPARPIGLLFFGFGQADIPAMQQIVKANGGFGGVWQIDKPEQIIGAMLQATGATLSFG